MVQETLSSGRHELEATALLALHQHTIGVHRNIADCCFQVGSEILAQAGTCDCHRFCEPSYKRCYKERLLGLSIWKHTSCSIFAVHLFNNISATFGGGSVAKLWSSHRFASLVSGCVNCCKQDVCGGNSRLQNCVQCLEKCNFQGGKNSNSCLHSTYNFCAILVCHY